MQASRNDCPISLLPEDVLWEIFLENAYRGPDRRPLTTARHCSQVCRKWRSIFLSSSTIWGKLLNMDDLTQATDDWRKEVVARTADALLWVYGKVCSCKQHDLFLNLLHHNWKRVEILDIEYWGFETPNLWAFPKEPAPQLCMFQIVTLQMKSNVLPLCLFGDNAPRLRHFSGCGMPYKFSNASWLPNLTSATFSRGFTAEEVLTALQRMPRLVSLVVHTKHRTLHWQGAPVSLPKLRMLEVQGALLHACALLECITPSPGCCLSIHDADYHSMAGGFGDHIHYEQYENIIKPYIISYFSLHPPSAVELRLLGNQLDLLLDPDEWGRRFHVVLDISFLPSSLLMKELMSSTSLSHIRTFNLQLLDDGNFASYFQTNTAVISAMEALSTSVTTLRTNEHTLRQLLKCPLSITSSLFPALVTLQFTGPSMTWPGDEPPHQTFLNLRKSMGRPFDVVTLSEAEDASVFSGCLKHHTGFLVKLGDR